MREIRNLSCFMLELVCKVIPYLAPPGIVKAVIFTTPKPLGIEPIAVLSTGNEGLKQGGTRGA